MLKPLLRAVDAGGRTVDDPSEEALHDLLAEMSLSCRFVILHRLDLEPVDQHYLQVYLNDDLSYRVEYREGSEGFPTSRPDGRGPLWEGVPAVFWLTAGGCRGEG